jgi:hypothetical protein
MSLREWATNGWIRSHSTSRDEIRGLFELADRDIKDSSEGNISNDRKFNIAYAAIRNLCLIPLYCSGYRTGRGESQHYRIIQSLPLTMGEVYKDRMHYFDGCRSKRNISDYDTAWMISEDEAKEILEEARRFRKEVESWVKKNYPRYFPF